MKDIGAWWAIILPTSFLLSLVACRYYIFPASDKALSSMQRSLFSLCLAIVMALFLGAAAYYAYFIIYFAP